jgi:putative inorganic carbon (HCO3(-)) transporter
MANPAYLKRSSFRQWLHYHFLEKKLNTVFGYVFLFAVAIVVSFVTSEINYKLGPAILALAGGFLLFIMMIRNPYWGFYFLIVFSAITVTIDRLIMVPLPLGFVIEGMSYIIMLNLLLKYDFKRNIDLRFWTNPITIGMYILFAYYVLELFNPERVSALGWLSYFRKQFSFFIFYYICYCLLNTREKIIYFIRFMIAITTIFAAYACKQQWFGYAGFELRYIGTGNGLTLLFQGGLLRKFSVFSDPSTSGILFASVAMLCIILLLRSNNKTERRWMTVALIFNLLGYSYSGTRTATLMIISGILLYCIATINERRTGVFLIFCAFAFTILMVVPFQSAVTNRIRSTFEGTKDASASVRDYDRHEVQPYIQAHPMGGGIFTSGFEGFKYNKGHYLEYLQPDSGYMKTIAEQGAIGLFLLLAFYFIVMRYGFRHFFRVKDPEIRTYYIGLLVMMFTLLVAQYSQMAITQYPLVFFFYAIMVIFIKLADFDKFVPPFKTTEN